LPAVALLPGGRRRDALAEDAWALLAEECAGRVLPFDEAPAAQYAAPFADRRASSRPLQGFDGLIAAIARARRARIATRNTATADFEGCGVDLLNPWKTAARTPRRPSPSRLRFRAGAVDRPLPGMPTAPRILRDGVRKTSARSRKT